MKKSNITVICGGPSVEHEVSVRSARFVSSALVGDHYDVQVILISHEGHWYRLADTAHFISNEMSKDEVVATATRVMPAMGCDDCSWISMDGAQRWSTNAVFPIMHGTLGEDGSLQGILRWLKLPFVGSDVLGSAVCMDKGVCKSLLAANDVPVAKWQLLRHGDIAQVDVDALVEDLGLPLFVKPADSGSSVGITKAHDKSELMAALKLASNFSRFILVEEAVDGREIELAVLGNRNPEVTLPGEIRSNREFYDYDAKYVDPNGAQLEIPAELPQFVIDELQSLAVSACELLQVEGLARVDFFVTEDNQVVLNEINTLPGFTNISMYPKMCEHQGIDAHELMHRLVAAALERFEQQHRLCYRYEDLLVEEL